MLTIIFRLINLIDEHFIVFFLFQTDILTLPLYFIIQSYKQPPLLMQQQQNWYIEYDYRTFQILRTNNFGQAIFTVCEYFSEIPSSKPQQVQVSQWTKAIANSINEILTLLFNFFYVEEKLTTNEIVKDVFLKIYTVLKVQNTYASLFYIRSENYRENRILSSSLRLNRFLQEIDHSILKIKSSLDKTFLQNLDQVYLFIQQKIKETLQKTQHLGDHDFNIILLDMLCLLLRNFGDSTMGKILDKTKERSIMDTIEKSNQTYQEFQISKNQEKVKFQQHQYFSVADEIEEDPENIKRRMANDEEDY